MGSKKNQMDEMKGKMAKMQDAIKNFGSALHKAMNNSGEEIEKAEEFEGGQKDDDSNGSNSSNGSNGRNGGSSHNNQSSNRNSSGKGKDEDDRLNKGNIINDKNDSEKSLPGMISARATG